MDDRPIGVFDSGVGGLTVVSALSNALQMSPYTMSVTPPVYHMAIKVPKDTTVFS